MKSYKILFLIGWALLIIQLLSWCGLNASDMKILNDAEDTYHYISLESSGLNLAKWFRGFAVGLEKLKISITNVFDEENKYSPLTANEYLSIYIRESLGASEEKFSFPLLLFDFNIVISYLSCGIFGIIFLICGSKIKNIDLKEDNAFCDNNISSELKNTDFNETIPQQDVAKNIFEPDTAKESYNVQSENDSICEIQTCSNNNELLFCRKCGTQLFTDSIYCHRCGTKVKYL